MADQEIDQLNSFLKGEISAAETYKKGIDKLAGDVAASKVSLLREINDEHGRHIQMLREMITAKGGTPVDGSGAWGLWAKTVMAAASLTTDAAALKALKEGEEHGLKDYEAGVDKVDGATASLVRTKLMPNCRKHIATIDTLMAQI